MLLSNLDINLCTERRPRRSAQKEDVTLIETHLATVIRRSFVLLISVIIIININIQNGGFNYEETNFSDSTIHSNPNGV
jgi:hypothetical protein